MRRQAVQQAALAGLPSARVSRLSGMPLHPRHYGCLFAAGIRAREELRIRAEDFVVMLSFGPETAARCTFSSKRGTENDTASLGRGRLHPVSVVAVGYA